MTPAERQTEAKTLRKALRDAMTGALDAGKVPAVAAVEARNAEHTRLRAAGASAEDIAAIEHLALTGAKGDLGELWKQFQSGDAGGVLGAAFKLFTGG